MQTTDTFNILRTLSLHCNTPLSETKEGCFLSVNNQEINGSFKGVKLFPGLEILTIDAHIISGFKIDNFFKLTEALHFVFCFEGSISHKFSSENEKKEIIQEAKQIVDLKELVTSILMVSDLSRQRE